MNLQQLTKEILKKQITLSELQRDSVAYKLLETKINELRVKREALFNNQFNEALSNDTPSPRKQYER